MGDFNEILKVEEFGDWINELNLVNMPIMGRKFTWRRGKSYSRLDRFLIDLVWIEKYPNLKLLGVKCSKLDHIPILLDSMEVN